MNKEMIDIFVYFGLTEKESKVLALIIEFKSVPAINFEASLQMRQPEVSVAIKSLQAKGWVRNGDKIKTGIMLRTGNSYELADSFETIIHNIHSNIKVNHIENIIKIKRLNTIRRGLLYV